MTFTELGLDDVFYTHGPLLRAVDFNHVVSVLAVVLMNAFFLVAEKALSKGLGWRLALQMFGYEIPRLLVLSIPMAFLGGYLDLPIGCTCHFIDASIDTGPIVGRRELPVRRGDTYEALCRGTMTLAGTLMREALEAYGAGTLERVPQGPGPDALVNMPPELVQEVARKLAEGRYAHYVD